MIELKPITEENDHDWRKNMKKTISILLAAFLFLLSACAGGTQPGVGSGDETTELTTEDRGDAEENDDAAVPNKDDADLTGPWHLDPDRNDLSQFATLFECYAEFGASMEIRADGQLSWYIGAEGGEGTWSVDGSLLTAELVRTADESAMTTEFDVLRDGDEIYLGMHWDNGIVFWSWGDDDSGNLAAQDAGENVVHLVNRRGDETTVYKLEDGRYMDRTSTVFLFDGVETWTDENGVEWNKTVE